MKKLLLLCAFALWLYGAPQPSAGVAQIDHLPSEGVWLHGEWLFCPQQFLLPHEKGECLPISMPTDWGSAGFADHGFGTYRLDLRLPAAGRYAIKIGNAAAVFDLFIDDQHIKSVGVVGKYAGQIEPAYDPKPIVFETNQSQVRLTLHTANFHHRRGGINTNIRLLHERDVMRYEMALYGKDLILLGAFGIMALYHFGLFLLRRRDRAALLFALLTTALSLRMMSTGQKLILDLWPQIPWTLLLRIEYISGYAALPLFVAFIGALYPRQSHLWVIRFYSVVSTAFVLWVLTVSSVWLTASRVWFEVILLTFIIYTLSVLLRSVWQREQGALVALGGFLVFGLCIVLDVLYFHNLIALPGDLIPLGFFVFVLSWSFVLAQKYAQAFTTIDRQRQDLERYQHELEDRVASRTLALARSLKDKEMLLKEVYHRVKNNLQLVVSLIGLKMRRLADPQTRSALEEIQNRIKAIALVHERLYQEGNNGVLELGEYMRSVAAQLSTLHSERIVCYEIGGERIPLGLDQAVPLGLIVNELMTNSLKYAFAGRPSGTIRITLHKKEGSFMLRYEDDGIGLPEKFEERLESQTLGVRIIHSLTRQIDASAAWLRPDHGVAFEITVPLSENGDRL